MRKLWLFTMMCAACGPTPLREKPGSAIGTGTTSETEPSNTESSTATTPSTDTPSDTGEPCELGAPCNPVRIDELPFFAEGDTTASTVRTIDLYDCGTSDEAGAEVWYQLEVDEPGLLIASVVDDAGTDVDVHILTGTAPDTCLDRDDTTAQANVEGTVYVVVDTWRDQEGMEYPGEYSLTVDIWSSSGDCPSDMVAIDAMCIDRYEAHLLGGDPFVTPSSGVAANASGAIPQGYISGTVAQAACQAAGKRLCTSSEWIRACEGPSGNVYPYGNTYQAGTCNEARPSHPVIDVFGSGASFSATELSDPRLNQLPDSLAPSGDFGQCVTSEGVFDMHGNLHEWVDDASGIFRGGFYVDASINGTGCSYRTTAHTLGYSDYSTGFRCCADR